MKFTIWPCITRSRTRGSSTATSWTPWTPPRSSTTGCARRWGTLPPRRRRRDTWVRHQGQHLFCYHWHFCWGSYGIKWKVWTVWYAYNVLNGLIVTWGKAHRSMGHFCHWLHLQMRDFDTKGNFSFVVFGISVEDLTVLNEKFVQCVPPATC